MYDFYDYKKEDPIADIEYVRGMYEAQVHKVKQEEYMKNLLFADYVRKIRSHRSRYDCIEDVFKKAIGQVEKKKKKEREQLAIIEEFIKEDFLNKGYLFKLTDIVSGGFECYYWRVEFEGFGQTFYIFIPNMNSINASNIKYAHNGMFAFGIKESECCIAVKETSYKIEDIANYINEYFQLDKVNEDDD